MKWSGRLHGERSWGCKQRAWRGWAGGRVRGSRNDGLNGQTQESAREPRWRERALLRADTGGRVHFRGNHAVRKVKKIRPPPLQLGVPVGFFTTVITMVINVIAH